MIFLIMETDIEIYETKVIEISKNHHVTDTDFGKFGDCYWIRLECDERKDKYAKRKWNVRNTFNDPGRYAR